MGIFSPPRTTRRTMPLLEVAEKTASQTAEGKNFPFQFSEVWNQKMDFSCIEV